MKCRHLDKDAPENSICEECFMKKFKKNGDPETRKKWKELWDNLEGEY